MDIHVTARLKENPNLIEGSRQCRSKRSFWAASLLLLPQAARAQTTTSLASSRSDYITSTISVLRVQGMARSQQLKSAWFEKNGSIPDASVPPAITKGVIATVNLNVARPPAAPKVLLVHKQNASGLQYVNVLMVSNTTSQELSLSYEPTSTVLLSNPIALQSPVGGGFPCRRRCARVIFSTRCLDCCLHVYTRWTRKHGGIPSR